MEKRMKTSISDRANVGIIVCGHREYWPQFPGAREAMIEYSNIFADKVRATGVNLLGSVFVDTIEDAYRTGVEFKSKDIDLLFVYLTAYVASGRYMLGALAAGCPVVIVGAQNKIKLDGLDLNKMVALGGPCPLPEAYSAFKRCGKQAAGVMFDALENNPRNDKETEEWCRAADAVRAFKGSVFGYMGHSYEGMLDMNFDPTAVTRAVGAHVKFVEMCELVDHIQKCTNEELQDKLKEINNTFERLSKSYDFTTKDIDDSDIEWAAQVAVGLDKLVQNNRLSGFAYYYMGENNSIYERAASNLMVGNSLMTTKGISMAGEGDMKTCLAMYLTSALGCGGSFSELCFVDWDDDIIMVGHDGPHDIRISDKKPTIRGLSIMHGKKGYGVSVEFSIKHGPMSMVAMAQDANGKYYLVVAEGESQEGWVPPIGNTLTRGYFGKDIHQFILDWTMSGVAHHASLAIGHCYGMVEKFGKLMGLDVVKVR
jgi:L-arabinose isomerase